MDNVITINEKNEYFRFLPFKKMDSHFSKEKLGVISYQTNAQLEDLKEVLKNNQILSYQLDLQKKEETDPFFQHIHTQWNSGCFFQTPDKQKGPSTYRFESQFKTDQNKFVHRNFLIFNENTETTLILDEKTDHNIQYFVLNQILVKSGAKLKLIRFQNLEHQSHFIARDSIILLKDAELEMITLSAGAAIGQTRTEVYLKAPGAKGNQYIAAKSQKKQYFEFIPNTHHISSDTTSSLELFSVVKDQARLVFNGNIDIQPGSKRIEAYQKNKNLLLSSEAIVDALPKLEISNDDVKCAHGATVSSIQADQLFYFETRGINRKEAEEMIVAGFTEPVINHLPTQTLKDYAHQLFGITHEEFFSESTQSA